MKEKFYFQFKDSEICYNKAYFDEYMKDDQLNAIEVYRAEKCRIYGAFWCKKHKFCGDTGSWDNPCGKECDGYKPRNKKNGCCIHYSPVLYEHGEKVVLKLNDN
jgi:hypothetical protein